jgi:hypothetical protein
MKKIDLSKFFLIEDTDLLTIADKDSITHDLKKMPFIRARGSTTDKFPYYSHTFIHRPPDHNYDSKSTLNVISNYFYFYFTIVKRFCHKYNINFKHVIRANINSTFFFPKYEYLDPHVDFSQEHLVILIYLNDVDVDDDKYNSTIIFDKKIDYSEEKRRYCYDLDHYKEKIPIKCEIKPKFGKIVCFNGSYFHANRLPKPGENRLVCVFNLLI